jgi:hypothetical protein
MAHRCVEWDGWEEGLVESILGPEEQEEEWFRDVEVEEIVSSAGVSEPVSESEDGEVLAASLARRKRLPFGHEKERVQMLDTTGDVCGGRGGELGRRLEALLYVNEGDAVFGRRKDEEDVDYETEAQ